MSYCQCRPCVCGRRVGLIAFSVPIFAMYLLAGFVAAAFIASCEYYDTMRESWNGVPR